MFIAVTFYSTLLAAGLMLAVKLYEVKRRRRSLVYKMFSYFDEWTRAATAGLLGAVRRAVGHGALFLREDLPKIVYTYLVKAVAHSREGLARMRVAARGIKHIKENPKISTFLRDIELAKHEIRQKTQGKSSEKRIPPIGDNLETRNRKL